MHKLISFILNLIILKIMISNINSEMLPNDMFSEMKWNEIVYIGQIKIRNLVGQNIVILIIISFGILC